MSDQLSIDAWYYHAVEGSSRERKILDLLGSEIPARLSVIFERACNLQCNHCIFQQERSSKQLSHQLNLPDIVPAMVEQLPKQSPEGNPPLLIHEGRILTPWHVDVLSTVRDMRPDVNIFLIDNGKTLAKCKPKLDEEDFTFNTVDISIDGTEAVHNHQRDDGKAYADARHGMSVARDVSDGVTSLFTITKINYSVIEETADDLLGGDLIDSWHLTGMSPARPEIKPHSASSSEWQEAWRQIRSAYRQYPQRTYIHLYNHSDLKMIVRAADQSLKEVIGSGRFGVEHGQIVFTIDGVDVEYSPLSIWPQETFLIDSDAACRLAYSLAYTLDELRSGTDRFGDDCSQYTVKQMTDKDLLSSVYRNCVDQWWEFRGKQYLKEEQKLFSELLG